MGTVLILVPKEFASQVRKTLNLWEARILCGTRPSCACDPVANLSESHLDFGPLMIVCPVLHIVSFWLSLLCFFIFLDLFSLKPVILL